MNLQHVLALFLFKSLANEVAFHLNVVFQRLLALPKVTQVCIGKLSLLLPQVAVAQSYACGEVMSKYLESKTHSTKTD